MIRQPGESCCCLWWADRQTGAPDRMNITGLCEDHSGSDDPAVLNTGENLLRALVSIRANLPLVIEPVSVVNLVRSHLDLCAARVRQWLGFEHRDRPALHVAVADYLEMLIELGRIEVATLIRVALVLAEQDFGTAASTDADEAPIPSHQDEAAEPSQEKPTSTSPKPKRERKPRAKPEPKPERLAEAGCGHYVGDHTQDGCTARSATYPDRCDCPVPGDAIEGREVC